MVVFDIGQKGRRSNRLEYVELADRQTIEGGDKQIVCSNTI